MFSEVGEKTLLICQEQIVSWIKTTHTNGQDEEEQILNLRIRKRKKKKWKNKEEKKMVHMGKQEK